MMIHCRLYPHNLHICKSFDGGESTPVSGKDLVSVIAGDERKKLFSLSAYEVICKSPRSIEFLQFLTSSLNQSARIFCTRAFWLLRHTDEPQRGRNSCLWLQSRSVLSSFGVVLMSCRVNIIAVFCLQNLICLLFIFADQVFIDPTFSGIFRLRSFAVLCG